MPTATPRGPARPEIPQAAATLRALLDAVRAVAVALPPEVPDPTAAAARLAGGVPALTGEPLLDGHALVAGARSVADALQGQIEHSPADAVASALAHLDGTDADLLADLALAGAWPEAGDVAARLGLDPWALTAIVDWASRPALRAAAARVRELIGGASWTRGSCPACGSAPVLSVVRGKEGERWLHCGRCGTGWLFPRVQCPACGERDHHRLGALHAVGEEAYRRAEVCESCRGYVKSVAALGPPDADTVAELDLATAGLDFIAVEAGYRARP